ncbi:MAG TPA: chemotaxis protein CheW [Gemmatimonadales bacterium]
MPHHLLLFSIDDLRFALPVSAVRETVRAVAITPLAGAPGVVEGVIDVRGTVTPVLDMRARFRLPPRPVRPSDHMVLAEAAGRQVALRVDRVLEVATVTGEDVRAARDDDPSMRHLAGVARLPDGLVLVGDLDAFLTQGEREALEVAEGMG